jgi:predicted Zn-dependent peptidase
MNVKPYLLATVALAIGAQPVAAQAPDRSQPPALGPAPTLSLPPIEEQALPNGLRVIYMGKRNVPLVQINVVVKTGSVLDPDDRPGLASMTAAMLDEGAGGRSAVELSEAVDFLGASLRVSSGMHTTTISLHAPLARLDAALELLADVVLRPAFSEEELDRQRRQRLTSLVQRHDQPRAIAQVIYDRSLFGDDHPYGRQSIGTPESLRDMTAADLGRFHARYFVPNNAAVIVVGDIGAADALDRLRRAFGSWQPGDAPQYDVVNVDQVRRREVILVDKPGAAQSVIRIGRIGAARSTEDYYALVVMNTILGGSFASRLNQKLREEKGYTYGARSFFSFRPALGPFTASADVQTAVTDSALYEFMYELRGILEDVTDAEMVRARNFVALRFPSGFQAVARIAGGLGSIYEYDLPLDYYNSYIQNILAVSKEDVLRVAREYIDPDRIMIVVVGDRSVIEDGVRALDLGPMRILSVEDVLGPLPEGG